MTDHNHENLVTHRQVLAFVLSVIIALLGATFTAGSTYFKVDQIGVSQDDLRVQVRQLQLERNQLTVEMATLRNDLAWQTETLRLVAQKLEVAVPIK